MHLIYGTYHLTPEQIETMIPIAVDLGITKFDTAQIYNNERIVVNNIVKCNIKNLECMTKIFSVNNTNQLQRLVLRSLNRFEKMLPSSILLHKILPHNLWHELVNVITSKKLNIKLGVSNYNLEILKNLFEYCNTNNIRKPEILQIEIHPFVNQNELNEMIEFCKCNSVSIQAHTVLTQKKYFNFPPLIKMTAKYNCKSAQILLAWCMTKNTDICINSTQKHHLVELLNSPKLDKSDIDEINEWYKITIHRFYNINTPLLMLLNESNNTIIHKIYDQLRTDMNAPKPSRLCELLSTNNRSENFKNFGRPLADKLFPNESGNNDKDKKFKELIRELLNKRKNYYLNKRDYKKGLHTCTLKNKSNYSNIITEPTPMPVDITDTDEFIPFFNFIENAEAQKY